MVDEQIIEHKGLGDYRAEIEEPEHTRSCTYLLWGYDVDDLSKAQAEHTAVFDEELCYTRGLFLKDLQKLIDAN